MSMFSNTQHQSETNDSNDLFGAVPRRPSLADTVIEQIEEAIIDGRLQPGDRLPTERELGRQFDVSRTVVREAVHALAAKNLIEVVPGSGMVVRQPSTQSISESISLLLNLGRPQIEVGELAEVRLYLETQIAWLAAQRRTDEQLAELEDLIEKMVTADAHDEFAGYDMAFHLKLAEATQNRLYLVLLNAVIDIVTNLSLIVSRDPENRPQPINFHRRILERVREGDANGAREAMREHLIAFEQMAHRASGHKQT